MLTDEAHRSQYDTLALNMHAALPKALFLAFTGTPLIAGEERTKDVFGDYVSIYDFQQSVGLNSETDWNESSEPFFTGTLDLGPARFRKCDEFGATGGADRPFLEGHRWRRRSSYLGSLAW